VSTCCSRCSRARAVRVTEGALADRQGPRRRGSALRRRTRSGKPQHAQRWVCLPSITGDCTQASASVDDARTGHLTTTDTLHCLWIHTLDHSTKSDAVQGAGTCLRSGHPLHPSVRRFIALASSKVSIGAMGVEGQPRNYPRTPCIRAVGSVTTEQTSRPWSRCSCTMTASMHAEWPWVDRPRPCGKCGCL
jgi:hypothetical protein